MKLDLDFSVVSRFFRGIRQELGQKKFWPVAAVLLAAIVAVPLLLSSSPSKTPVAQAPLPASPPASASLPALNVQATPTVSHLNGPSHNPFDQGSTSTSTTSTTSTASAPTGGGSTTTTSSSSGSTSTGSSGSSSSTSSGSSSSSSSGSSSTTSSSGSTPPPSITGNAKPKQPTGLSSNESYDVAFAITNTAGGVNTVDPFERLSLVPNNQEPLLVELGVLQGGSRVLFAVQPGTVLNGPGACTPGPIDCEVLSLAQDQTEAVSSRDSGANALFAITGITAVKHSSVAAANQARDAKSAAGQRVLDSSDLPAVSLFKYEPSVGSVVDLRDLTVGG